jgi:two-component system, OmpR family, phosphate regulon sensor histidine kinase PhoR
MGMRWWLAGAFVAVAVLTAAVIVTVSSRQVGRAVTQNSRDIAIGQTVSIGFALSRSSARWATLEDYRGRDGLALFLFDRDGRLVAQAHGATGWAEVPRHATALERALAGRRYAASFGGGRDTVVALPMRRTPGAAALVAYAPRAHAYAASLSIFRSEVLHVALWTTFGAAALGLCAAALISRRLRRIAAAAQAIERGGFDSELEPGFLDEVGLLAQSVERMRRRLGDAFEQLAAERDRLELLLDRLHEAVLAVDEELTVQYANASMRRLIPELEPNVRLPEHFGDLPLRAVVRELFQRGTPVSEARTTTPDGATYAAVGIPAAGTGLAVLVLADITQHERQQRAEREFVANASHELRTPVAAISTAVEALELGAREDPEARDRFIALIGRQATRLTRLTSSLLVLARAQTREEGMPLVEVDLEPFLEQVASSSDVPEVRVERNGGSLALAQPDVLAQVVANLVANAVKHAPGTPVVLRAASRRDEAVIEVADRGPGISAELRERIFDRFYAGGSAGRGGFGLGLAIARDSAEAMGGRLELDSQVGVGTTARVILRRA